MSTLWRILKYGSIPVGSAVGGAAIGWGIGAVVGVPEISIALAIVGGLIGFVWGWNQASDLRNKDESQPPGTSPESPQENDDPETTLPRPNSTPSSDPPLVSSADPTTGDQSDGNGPGNGDGDGGNGGDGGDGGGGERHPLAHEDSKDEDV
jgi:hypothetical protein